MALATLASCGPKQPVPSGPDHPADPTAAEAPEPPAPHGAEAGASDPEALIAAEMKAYEAAKPVFGSRCASCHTSRGASSMKLKKKALEHFSIDSYPFTGHHAGELGATIRKVLGVEGDEPTMPMDDPGAVEGEELALIVAWSRAYDRAKDAGAGHHGTSSGHDHGGHRHGHGD